ncbi:MAG TPA: SMI1/KNR4 family protein [Pyrinomonadaceae bacterium]|nr:SMI1/KNR4 family protein [Pyrinomonadaceae bacterium]
MKLNHYQQIADCLYPPFKPSDGISLEEIERVERAKKFTLPKVLRDFYLLVGNHEAINYSFNRLIGIENIEIEKRKLVFYNENQGVCNWAIDKNDLKQEDPPVWQGQWIHQPNEIDWYSEQDDPLVWQPQWINFHKDKIEWHLETSRLSVFLTSMICWQSVMGGLPFCAGSGKVEDLNVKKIESNFEEVDFGEDYKEFRAFIDEGKVLCVSAGEHENSLNIAASNKNKLLEIIQFLSIQWNYNSLDDE